MVNQGTIIQSDINEKKSRWGQHDIIKLILSSSFYKDINHLYFVHPRVSTQNGSLIVCSQHDTAIITFNKLFIAYLFNVFISYFIKNPDKINRNILTTETIISKTQVKVFTTHNHTPSISALITSSWVQVEALKFKQGTNIKPSRTVKRKYKHNIQSKINIK